MPERLLVTGADGYVGRLLVEHYLTNTDRPLMLWTRARDTSSALARFGGIVRAADLASGRVRLVGGDLHSAEPFAAVDPHEVDSIVHLAAVTSFTVTAAEADAVNRQGTEKLLQLARRCPGLQSVCLASTIYASGLTSGAVPERALERPSGFANEYERTKWEAERLADASPALGVPISVVRLATVVADDETGRAGVHNAVHNTLSLLRQGLLSLMPGDPDTPVYLITGALAVRALAAAIDGRAIGFVHAAHRSEDSLTLGRALDIAFEVFAREDGFARRVRRPRFADLTSFGLLAEGASSFGGGILGQALGSLLPFARQLYVAKHVENDALRRLLPGYRADDAAELFAAACSALLHREAGSASVGRGSSPRGSRVPA